MSDVRGGCVKTQVKFLIKSMVKLNYTLIILHFILYCDFVYLYGKYIKKYAV